MNNTLTTNDTGNLSDLSAYAVQPTYLRARMEFFASKYEKAFPHWTDFFAAYSRKELPPDNLDYDEWAFFCEQLVYQDTESSPPCDCIEFKEGPESSGPSHWRAKSCSIQQPTSLALN